MEAGDAIKALVLAALRDARALYPFCHHGHVLLDDHLHLLSSPALHTAVPDLVGSFKRAVAARLPQRVVTGRLWQRRYCDNVIRDSRDFAAHLDYLHFNPVKHGLVAHAAQWPRSSLSAWMARGVYPDGWGGIDPDEPLDVAE